MPKGKGFAMSTDHVPCPYGGGAYRSCCAPLLAAISVPKRPNS